jgi:hypothetical protein
MLSRPARQEGRDDAKARPRKHGTHTLPVARGRGVGGRRPGHLRSGLPCQDAHDWRLEAGGAVLVAAVADGAGSAECAEEGARAAVKAAVEQAAAIWRIGRPTGRDDWGQLIEASFSVARLAVQSAARAQNRSIHDLATTLLLLVATPGQTAAGQVGDGAVVARLGDGELTALTRPPHTEHLNETTFLTSDDGAAEMQFALHDGPAHGLALLTDGLQMLALKMPQGEPHPPFFAPLFRFAAGAAEPDAAGDKLTAFLQSPGVATRTDDDLTLVLAVRQPAR